MSYDLVLQQSSLIAKNTAHSESRQQEAEPGSSTRSQNRLLPSCSPCSLGAPPAPSVLPLCSLCAPSVLPLCSPLLPRYSLQSGPAPFPDQKRQFPILNSGCI